MKKLLADPFWFTVGIVIAVCLAILFGGRFL